LKIITAPHRTNARRISRLSSPSDVKTSAQRVRQISHDTLSHPQPQSTMAYVQLRRIAIVLAFAAVCVYAEKHASSIASMSIPEIEDKLQVS
jgi:hypothetical protein